MGDNLRGSLDKVTNVEAFQGVADQQVGGTISTLLRFLEVSALVQKRLGGVFFCKRWKYRECGRDTLSFVNICRNLN